MSTVPTTYRQRQAAATRDRVVAAARRVFAERGYSAATIADVAEAAGVAVPTVYKLYGSKRALLSALADAWATEFAPNQFEDVPETAAEAIAWWVAVARRQWETGLDIALIYAGAVAAESEVRLELEPRLRARERAIRAVCSRLPERNRAAAVGIVSALTLPELYRDLVGERGWTPDEYQAWLERTLRAQVL